MIDGAHRRLRHRKKDLHSPRDLLVRAQRRSKLFLKLEKVPSERLASDENHAGQLSHNKLLCKCGQISGSFFPLSKS
jgi:hypothetical protein